MSEESGFKAPALPIDHVLPMISSDTEITKDVVANPEPSEMSLSAPQLPYTAPPWSSSPDGGLGYKLEILKGGAIVDTFDVEKRKDPTFIVIGRLPICDIQLDHPSISRYHCIIQYGEDTMSKSGMGWHVYDLGSTHGSKLNKKKLPAKQYVRLHVGFVLQFGGSSRIFSLLGPETDIEPEWECSPTEMKQKMHKKLLDAKLAAAARKEIEAEKEREAREEEGISWGMDYGEDDTVAPLIELESHLAEDGDAYYNSDPKKALTKFFEREGFDMQFDYSETGQGHNHKWICSIELPIEIDGVDRAFTAQATVTTSKKDAAVQCALEACRILDKHGVLRKSNTKARLKKKTLAENDFYDEDDDLYLDRTGQLEEQREKRRQWAANKGGKGPTAHDTYESLCSQLEQAKKDIVEVNKQLEALSASVVKKATDDADSLDDYCKQLKEGGAGDDLKTKTQKSVLRQRLVVLTHESQKLEKLAKIAKPVALPALTMMKDGVKIAAGADKQAFLRKMMMYGRVKKDTESAIIDVDHKAGIPFKPENDDDELSENNIGPSMPTVAPESATETPIAESTKEIPMSTKVIDSSDSETPPLRSVDVSDTTSLSDSAHTSTETHQSEVAVESLPNTSADDERHEESADMKRQIVKEIVGENDEDAPATKKKRIRVRQRERKEPTEIEEYGVGCETRDELYSTWMPPTNQSGDGKTKLHEKFGGRY